MENYATITELFDNFCNDSGFSMEIAREYESVGNR